MDEHLLPFERRLMEAMEREGLPPLPERKYAAYKELLVEGHPPRRPDIEEYCLKIWEDPSGREVLTAKMKEA